MTDLQNEGRKIGRSRANLMVANIIEQERQQTFAELLMPPPPTPVAKQPPSLKEQALGALSSADKDALTNPLTGEVVALRTILSKEQSDTIRKALEQLND